MVRRSQNDRVKRGAAACPIDGRSCAPRPWRRAAARPSTEPVRQDSAERRQLTVMFCDLVGSTALLARLDPEDLRGHRRLSSLLHGRQVLGRRGPRRATRPTLPPVCRPLPSRTLWLLQRIRDSFSAISCAKAHTHRLLMGNVAGDQIRVPLRGPHCLRHGCAGHLVAAGISLKEIGDHLGHRGAYATRVYAKADLAGLREVADFDLRGLA
jgi:integrase